MAEIPEFLKALNPHKNENVSNNTNEIERENEDLEKKAPKDSFIVDEYYFDIFIEKTTNKEKELMWFLIKHRNQFTNTIDLNNKKLRAKTGIQKGNFNRYIRKLAKLGLITETKTSRVFLINPRFCYNKDYEYWKYADTNWTFLTNHNNLMERLNKSYQQKNYELIAKTLQENGITAKEFAEICERYKKLENSNISNKDEEEDER